MTDIVFENLTHEQKKYICNGCGGKGGFRPPQFVFKEDCNIHDVRYYIGCTEDDKKFADREFYVNNIKQAQRFHWFMRLVVYKALAWIYYKSVAWKGKQFFYYGPKKKTLEDLIEEMKK